MIIIEIPVKEASPWIPFALPFGTNTATKRPKKRLPKYTLKAFTTALRQFLRDAGFAVKTATLDEPEHGLTQEVLDNTDVLFWWGHMAHGEVKDEIVERVYRRVMDGMGMVVLHSGHASKIMQKLMGTNSGELKWREIGEKEILWAVSPSHPILRGLPEKIVIEHEEMYGEFFNIPDPDELVLISWFGGGNVFRSGLCYKQRAGQAILFPARSRIVPHLLSKRSAADFDQRGELGRACAVAPDYHRAHAPAHCDTGAITSQSLTSHKSIFSQCGRGVNARGHTYLHMRNLSPK